VKLLGLAPIALLLLLVGCSARNNSFENNGLLPTPGVCNPPLPHAAGEFDETIMLGGLERKYILHIPTGYDGMKRAPIVLLLGGLALDSRIMLDYTGMGAVADREGFILVSLEGSGEPLHWNYAHVPGGADDVGSARDLLAKLGSELCIDPTRTFATGFSSGSAMAERLACDIPDVIAAVGLVEQLSVDCEPKTPLIVFHGEQDQLVPFAGGGENEPVEGGGSFPPVRETVRTWAQSLGCDAGAAVVMSPAEHVELTSYQGCRDVDRAVLLYVTENGGHAWPGAAKYADPATTTQEIDASELIWQFFSAIRP
jgi:polyhydroxybutyrate depolymerase